MPNRQTYMHVHLKVVLKCTAEIFKIMSKVR